MNRRVSITNSPVHVAIDYQIFSSQRFGGISRYFVELTRICARRVDCDVTIVAPVYVNAYLRSLDASLVCGWPVPFLPKTHTVRRALNAELSGLLLRRRRPDITHETYYSRESCAPKGVPTVLTVYDMIHEKFPQYFADASRVAAKKHAAVKRATHIICISESTRRDLLETIPLNPEKVSVIHLASYIKPSLRMNEPAADVIGSPYLLYVGQREGYKNFAGFLRALSTRKSILHDLRVALFGGGGLTALERASIRELGLPEKAFISVEGDESQLPHLYSRAAALVYPSLYEGFGMPILEAMGCGCPVVCGRGSSLSEVAGDAAEYCDPTDAESMAHAILQVLDSKRNADRLRKLGLKRQQTFSWEICAERTCNIYTSLRRR